MSQYNATAICLAVDNHGQKLVVYDPYWSFDGRFIVKPMNGKRVCFIMAKKNLTPIKIINEELAVKYGFSINEPNEEPSSETLQQEASGEGR